MTFKEDNFLDTTTSHYHYCWLSAAFSRCNSHWPNPAISHCHSLLPRSAMQQVPFFLTNIFLLFKSRCAIAGFPVKTIFQCYNCLKSIINHVFYSSRCSEQCKNVCIVDLFDLFICVAVQRVWTWVWETDSVNTTRWTSELLFTQPLPTGVTHRALSGTSWGTITGGVTNYRQWPSLTLRNTDTINVEKLEAVTELFNWHSK